MTEEVIVLNRRPDRPKKTLYFPEEDGYVFLRTDKKEAISGLCKFNFESSIVFLETIIEKNIYYNSFEIDTVCYSDIWQKILEDRKNEKKKLTPTLLEFSFEDVDEGFFEKDRYYWVVRKNIRVHKKKEGICRKKIIIPEEIDSALKDIDLVRRDDGHSIFFRRFRNGKEYKDESFTKITNVITSFEIRVSLESSESFTRNYELDFTYLKDGKRYVDYQDGKSNRNILLTINFDPSDRQFFEEILNSLELKIKLT